MDRDSDLTPPTKRNGFKHGTLEFTQQEMAEIVRLYLQNKDQYHAKFYPKNGISIQDQLTGEWANYLSEITGIHRTPGQIKQKILGLRKRAVKYLLQKKQHLRGDRRRGRPLKNWDSEPWIIELAATLEDVGNGKRDDFLFESSSTGGMESLNVPDVVESDFLQDNRALLMEALKLDPVSLTVRETSSVPSSTPPPPPPADELACAELRLVQERLRTEKMKQEELEIRIALAKHEAKQKGVPLPVVTL